MTVEKELKILLTSDEFERLQSLSDAPAVLQINHYFACPSAQVDEMLRIRQKAGKFLMAYKRRFCTIGDVFSAEEYEKELTKDQAERFLQNGVFGKDAQEILGVDLPDGRSWKFVGSLSTLRTAFYFRGFPLELDANEYLGARDFELECEGDDVDFAHLREALAEVGVFGKPSCPKSQRFFQQAKLNTTKQND